MDFSSARLALVAHAFVNADGTSPDINSGVITSRDPTGYYVITLPGSRTSQTSLQEGQSISPMQRLTLVTGSPPPDEAPLGILEHSPTIQVQDVDDYVTRVHITDSNGDYEAEAFSILIYRPVISAPLDTNG
jgi:hypothetical protein